MANIIFFSGGKVRDIQANNQNTQRSTVQLDLFRHFDYITLYRQQPNVRVCVDFLARNIAQLGLHIFQDVGDDRIRVRDHPLSLLLQNPLPSAAKSSQYRMIEAIVSDLGIFNNAFLLKLREGKGVGGLIRIPANAVTVFGSLVPEKYQVELNGTTTDFIPDDVVHFRGYNPENPIYGLSPLETLRRVLAEEYQAGEYRENFWRNKARIESVIERPSDAPDWSEQARTKFINELADMHTGKINSGSTVVLEEGMTYRPIAFSAQQSEYLAGRKLTREECARAYHIPLPMVGILEHATFSNIKEQHKQLYQDSLGPLLAMMEQDLHTQLLPDLDSNPQKITIEFNIQEKLQGSFEEQITALRSSVGTPWMSVNEARRLFNLSKVEGGDEILKPLNMSNPQEPEKAEDAESAESEEDETTPEDQEKKSLVDGLSFKNYQRDIKTLRTKQEAIWESHLKRYYNRVEKSVTSKYNQKSLRQAGELFDKSRFDRELSKDLQDLNYQTIAAFVEFLDAQTGSKTEEEYYREWVEEHSQYAASDINRTILENLAKIVELEEDEIGPALGNFFGVVLASRLTQQSKTSVTTSMNFGLEQAARSAGMFTKTWRTTSTSPRSKHKNLNGTTIDIEEKFSNGLRWPGDPKGDPEENANCRCYIVYN